MAYIKMAWAIFLGTVVGIILGIIFDWAMQNGYVLEKGAEYAALYPWVAGGGAFFGALMAVIVIGPQRANRSAAREKSASRKPSIGQAQKAKPVVQPAKAAKATKAKPGTKAKQASAKDKDFVEGMPSFDFSASSKDIPAEPMPRHKGKK